MVFTRFIHLFSEYQTLSSWSRSDNDDDSKLMKGNYVENEPGRQLSSNQGTFAFQMNALLLMLHPFHCDIKTVASSCFFN